MMKRGRVGGKRKKQVDEDGLRSMMKRGRVEGKRRKLEKKVESEESDSDSYGLLDYVEPEVPKDFIPLPRLEFELLDTSNAVPITLDLDEELRSQDYDRVFLRDFITSCYNKSKLLLFDYAGNNCNARARAIIEGNQIDDFHREIGEYAFQWYRLHCPNASNKRLKEISKMNISMHTFHVTFVVVDDATKEEITLQATIHEIWFTRGVNRYRQLGMLRDATHDQVLAIIRLKQAPTGDMADKFSSLLEKVGEKVLVKT